MIEEGASTRGLEVSGWKMKQSNIGRRAELARRNTQLDEIREIGRGLVVQLFKGKNNNFVLNTGFHQKTVQSTKNRRYVVRPGRTTGEAGSIILKFIPAFTSNPVRL